MKIWRKKIRNAKASYRALYILLREGVSFRAHIFSGFVTIIAAFVLQVSTIEFLILIITIGAVLTTEALNTAIEELCNHVTPDQHPQIGKVKDLASGASGIMGITALLIGCIIFIPHLVSLL
jgi:diacylglycerol kinase